MGERCRGCGELVASMTSTGPPLCRRCATETAHDAHAKPAEDAHEARARAEARAREFLRIRIDDAHTVDMQRRLAELADAFAAVEAEGRAAAFEQALAAIAQPLGSEKHSPRDVQLIMAGRLVQVRGRFRGRARS